LAGEDEVRSRGAGHVVVRTGWLFGTGDDFFSRAVRRLADGAQAGGIVDRTGTPTYVSHLADRLVSILDSDLRGLVHVAGPEPISWFDLLARARQMAGLPGDLIEQKSADLSLPAPRPRNSALASEVLPVPGVAALPPLDQGLADLLDRMP
jgi:dTDP-4-dehydrorhamnose reductase